MVSKGQLSFVILLFISWRLYWFWFPTNDDDRNTQLGINNVVLYINNCCKLCWLQLLWTWYNRYNCEVWCLHVNPTNKVKLKRSDKSEFQILRWDIEHALGSLHSAVELCYLKEGWKRKRQDQEHDSTQRDGRFRFRKYDTGLSHSWTWS